MQCIDPAAMPVAARKAHDWRSGLSAHPPTTLGPAPALGLPVGRQAHSSAEPPIRRRRSAKVIAHARSTGFQMAEVAVLPKLFRALWR